MSNKCSDKSLFCITSCLVHPIHDVGFVEIRCKRSRAERSGKMPNPVQAALAAFAVDTVGPLHCPWDFSHHMAADRLKMWSCNTSTLKIHFLKTKTFYIENVQLWNIGTHNCSFTNFSCRNLRNQVFQKHYKTLHDITVGWTLQSIDDV